MTTQISPNGAIPIPQTGDPSSAGTWGVIQGTGIDIIDGLLCAVESVAVGGAANVVLTFSPGNLDQTDAAHFNFTGVLTGNVVVLWPNGRDRVFSCTNNTTGAFTLSVGVNNGAGMPAGTTQSLGPGLTNQFISDGTNVLTRGSGGLSAVTQQSFGAGVHTYTPTPGTLYAIVRQCASGAGGYQQAATTGGGGGGAGEGAEDIFTAAQIGVSQTVTVGAGGAVSTNGNSTSFGALLTALGGSTGTNGSPKGGLGGTGGIGSGTAIHFKGGDGFNASLYGASAISGGNGGPSLFGGGGVGGLGNLDNAQPGKAPGSGGGGNGNVSGAFGLAAAGADGICIVTEFH